MSEKICANCDGEGWVCENHPEVPWLGGTGCCGGAGMMCACNRSPDDPLYVAPSEPCENGGD